MNDPRFELAPYQVKIAYLCHPFISNPEANTSLAVVRGKAVQEWLGEGWYVLVPHLMGLHMGDVHTGRERQAMAFCLRMVIECDMLVVAHRSITGGMSEEISMATRIGREMREAIFGEGGTMIDLREYGVERRA